MKVRKLVMSALIVATFAPSAADAQLWYNGNYNGIGGVASSSSPPAMVYDNFVVTGSGWTVGSIFGTFLKDEKGGPASAASYEIRSGMSVNNGGSIVATGNGVAASWVGNADNTGLYTITGLSIFLLPGTYWLGIAPEGSHYVVSTSGAGGSNANIDGLSLFKGSPNGVDQNFVDVKAWAPSFNGDFSYGVDAPAGTPSVVPEPATMTLLATGLAGLAAARRRRKAARG